MVRDYLNGNVSALRKDPEKAFAAAVVWDAAYQRAYLKLKGQPRSESDLKKIHDEIADRLDPTSIARDKAKDALIKSYLPRLAPVLAFLESAPVEALAVYLIPSEIASDLDELEQANKSMHDALWSVLNPVLRPDWKTQYSTILQNTPVPGPEIKPAR